jgi:cytochrome c6
MNCRLSIPFSAQCTVRPTAQQAGRAGTKFVPKATSGNSSQPPAAVKQHPTIFKGFPTEVVGLFAAGLVLCGSLAGGKAIAGGDLAQGKQVFDANCAACHTGGGNTVLPDHTLSKAAIDKFLDGGLNITAIVYQVQNGKNQMPAWEETLEDDEIQAVASYVYDQATNDKW